VLTQEKNIRLTHTGPNTAMGAVFRQYWIPVLLSRQLPEPDGSPVRVKVLGEELLAFRASDGQVGLVSPRCPHRGADLYFGRNEEQGIRCSYHGWKFDLQGQCVHMPTSNDHAYCKVKDRARLTAYPVREWGDMLWAYMGPLDCPELPLMEFALVPENHRYVSKKLQECNWAQAAEGGIDTAHFSFLHQPIANSDKEWSDKSARMTRGYYPPKP